MRWKTESGNVVSSHSSACGASSFCANLRIDSRSCSWSSLKMKWRRLDPKSGLRTSLGAAASAGAETGLDMKWTVELSTFHGNRYVSRRDPLLRDPALRRREHRRGHDRARR